MNIFKEVTNLRYETKTQHNEIEEYRDLVKRFLVVSKILSSSFPYADSMKSTFESYVRSLEFKAVQDSEREKIRGYVKEILAETPEQLDQLVAPIPPYKLDFDYRSKAKDENEGSASKV
jgi:uncharacterized protein YaaR (DUF327 family)